MALKLVINELVEVIGPLRDDYKKGADGKFHLVLEGEHPDTAKLAEFRTNNRNLHGELELAKTKLKEFAGIEPEAAKAALAKLPELAKMKDSAPRVAELESQLAAERSAHDSTKFKQIVIYEFMRHGGRESAVDFTVGNAAKDFKMVDGKLVTELFSAKNPGIPLTVDEWVVQQMPIHDYTFLPSRGGGARPSQGGPPPRQVISKHDPLAVGRNLEDIASGKVVVE